MIVDGTNRRDDDRHGCPEPSDERDRVGTEPGSNAHDPMVPAAPARDAAAAARYGVEPGAGAAPALAGGADCC